MDFFNNAAVTWFVVGFVLFLIEFGVPGLIFFFFGVGAWITALVYLVTGIDFNIQLVVFLASSVLFLLIFRKWMKNLLWSKKNSSEIEDEFVGKIGIALTAISPGKDGKVDFKGTVWDARAEETIGAGDQVMVTGNDSILLMVKPAR